MAVPTAIPADPSGDRELELIAGLPDAVGNQLRLERVHEGLGERVVIRVAGRPQRREDPVVVEGVVEVLLQQPRRTWLAPDGPAATRARVDRRYGSPNGLACATTDAHLIKRLGRQPHAETTHHPS
jgi:hypothetical protein